MGLGNKFSSLTAESHSGFPLELFHIVSSAAAGAAWCLSASETGPDAATLGLSVTFTVENGDLGEAVDRWWRSDEKSSVKPQMG